MRLLGFAFSAMAAAAIAASSISPASGQTAISGSNSSSGAASNSGAASGSTLILDQSSKNSGNVSPQAAYQPSDITMRNVPQVYAPGVVTGNVCALGASIGGAFVGFGLTAAATWESERCELRQQIALFYNMGRKASGDQLACTLSQTAYLSLKAEGVPCAYKAEWEPKPGTQPVPPVVAAPLPVVPTVTPMPATRTASNMVQRCYNNAGRVVPPGTPGASCGMVPVGSP